MGVYISIYIYIMMISNGKNIVRHHCFQHFAYRSHSIFFECSIPQRMPSLVSLRSLCTFDTKLWLWTTYEVVITKIPQLIVISVDFQFNHSISYIVDSISLALFLTSNMTREKAPIQTMNNVTSSCVSMLHNPAGGNVNLFNKHTKLLSHIISNV